MNPPEPASKAHSHTLTAASWLAEDPISSGVPPPLPLPVDVDVLEVEVELLVCDVPVEVSEGDTSGATVIPTTATLVVVGPGVTVIGTTVVVEDVAAAWGVEGVDVSAVDVDVLEVLGVLEVLEALELVVVIVVNIVVDALASPAAD